MLVWLVSVGDTLLLVYAPSEYGVLDVLVHGFDQEDIDEAIISRLPVSDVPTSFVLVS